MQMKTGLSVSVYLIVPEMLWVLVRIECGQVYTFCSL